MSGDGRTGSGCRCSCPSSGSNKQALAARVSPKSGGSSHDDRGSGRWPPEMSNGQWPSAQSRSKKRQFRNLSCHFFRVVSTSPIYK
jgi:hypothetical protein